VRDSFARVTKPRMSGEAKLEAQFVERVHALLVAKLC